jgi:transposase InsO family protein
VNVRFNGADRIVVPPSLIADVLRQFHDMNHVGAQKMVHLIASRFWWLPRDIEVTEYVKTCHTCQLVKPPNESAVGASHPIETPDGPNSVWGMDTIILGSAAASTACKYILTVVNHHSRYVWATATKQNTTDPAINFLKRLFEAVGTPTAILTDNGTNCTSNAFRKFLE